MFYIIYDREIDGDNGPYQQTEVDHAYDGFELARKIAWLRSNYGLDFDEIDITLYASKEFKEEIFEDSEKEFEKLQNQIRIKDLKCEISNINRWIKDKNDWFDKMKDDLNAQGVNKFALEISNLEKQRDEWIKDLGKLENAINKTTKT